MAKNKNIPVADALEFENTESTPEDGVYLEAEKLISGTTDLLIERLMDRCAPVLIVLFVLFWVVLSGQLVNFNLGGIAVPATESDAQIRQLITHMASSYSYTVIYPQGTARHYPLSSAGISVNVDKTLAGLRLKQNTIGSKLAWWQSIDEPLSLNIDQAKMNDFIEKSMSETVQPVLSPGVSVSSKTVSITNDVASARYGLPQPISSLVSSAVHLDRASLKLKALAVSPSIPASVLTPYSAQIDNIVRLPVSIRIGGFEFVPSAGDIAGWLQLSWDAKNDKLAISVSSAKVLAYIDSKASYIGSTPQTQVVVKTRDGTVQAVKGIDGFSVSGEAEAADSIAQALLSGNGIAENLSFNRSAFSTVTVGNYAKWIEVNLTSKQLRAYRYSRLLASYPLTAGSPDTPTVTGAYSIASKNVLRNMGGRPADSGSPDQQYVPWVDYFYKGYALVGDYWTPTSYFGSINSTKGSIGLSTADAERLYGWATTGTPVIIHT